MVQNICHLHFSLDVRPIATSVLNMTQTHQMVSLQFWSFGECRVPI